GAALTRLDLDRHRVMPRRQRIAPRLDGERPHALGIRHQIRMPSVETGCAVGHPKERQAAAVRRPDNHIRANSVVTFPEYRGRDGNVLTNDRPGRMLTDRGRTYDRADVR